MTFDLSARKGKVILNISTVAVEDSRAALRAVRRIFEAGLSMGRLIAVAPEGGQIGDFDVPRGCLGIGTVCSVSINGIFLRSSIATTSRFGGLLEMEEGQPKRFTQIINYDGSSLDPLEVFIRGHMTSVSRVAEAGSGLIGASFREVPRVALPDVRHLSHLSEQAGLGGVLAVGNPNQPLLDIPVAQGRVGLVVCGGLNPVAAVAETGIAVTSAAMSTMCDFSELVDFTEAIPER